MSSLPTNVLFYGDNLPVLRDMPDESVDLVYLDPPFNSNSDYNAIFRDESGQRSDAQIKAFEDTWHWGPSAQEHYDYLTNTGIHKGRVPDPVTGMVGAFIQALGKNQMTAYLVEMTVRIIELQRILKSTGSLYLHCDPTASHYLKLVLDASFGPERFRNEIIWRRTAFHGKVKRFGPIHDVILYYTKSDKFTFHAQTRPYMRGHVEAYFKQDERGWKTAYYGNVMTGAGTSNGESGQPWRGIDPTAKGRHWAIPGALLVGFEEEVAHMGQHEKMDFLFEKGIIKLVEGQAWPMYERYLSPGDGMSVGDIWSYQPYTEGTVFGTEAGIDADVRWLSPQDKERLGYPTQKPVALLERIISASSNPGDVVLDPFCGCGTSVAAAQQLGRRWVGIDLTYLSIAVMKKRMQDHFPELGKIEVIGAPTELEGARRLAADEENGRYQFQWWALDQIGGTPRGADKKKGADGGIDGIISFSDARGVQSVIVSVKSGGVQAKDIRELNHVVEREKAAIGILVTLEEPSKPMRDEAAQAGTWQSELYNKSYPKIQIITAREIIEDGKMPDLPPLLAPQYRQAERVKKSAGDQGELFDE